MLSGINHLEQKSYLLLFFVVVVFFFPSLLAVCAVHIPSIFVSSSHHGHHPEAAYVCGAENSAHLNSALLRLREVIFQTPIPRGKSIHCGVFLRGISPFSRLPEGGKRFEKKREISLFDLYSHVSSLFRLLILTSVVLVVSVSVLSPFSLPRGQHHLTRTQLRVAITSHRLYTNLSDWY